MIVVALGLAACESSSDSPGNSLPDGGGVDAPVASTCAAATGPGTTHDQTLTADETWTAATSPHVLSTSLSIPAGRTITIEPCAVVQLKGAIGILVEGKLLAVGAAGQPIRFERGEAATAWTSIEARKGSELKLAYVTVEGGGNTNGSAPTGIGALDIRGDQESATQPILFADHVTVKGSQSLGIQVREGGGFAPGSQELSITGGASFPISIWGRAAGTLPSGTYTGNATDEIILPALGGRDDIKEDTTLAARGVPYRIGGPTGGKSLVVAGAASVPLLTIEPGVTLRFDKDARLDLDGTGAGVALGALRAEGTAERPIVFTSSATAPAAGAWVGIVIEGTPDPRDRIAHAKISFAGASSQISSFDCPRSSGTFSNDGAILVVGGKPASAFITDTTIESSAGDGIIRGWTGDPVELLATNTFTNVTGCNQTFPKPTTGTCPDPAPCPK